MLPGWGLGVRAGRRFGAAAAGLVLTRATFVAIRAFTTLAAFAPVAAAVLTRLTTFAPAALLSVARGAVLPRLGFHSLDVDGGLLRHGAGFRRECLAVGFAAFA